ncbi:MAG: SSI family serine proteinase inhibitor [Pseudomonadota bacterium]
MLVLALAAVVALGPATSLTITEWPRGRGDSAPRTWTLRCGPVAGTLPRRAAACRQLLAVRTPFAPVPPGTACTEIYGGPQEALVRGRHRGRPVWARFDRRDGCAIARWNRVSLLFPLRVGVA